MEEGLVALEDALAEVDRTDVRFHEAELYRLKGELLLGLPRTPEHRAAACFHRAIEIARHREAKSVELRAAMSLSRLVLRHGKQDDARRLLAEVYGWFTEGFDTADLKEARLLLDQLSREPEHETPSPRLET